MKFVVDLFYIFFDEKSSTRFILGIIIGLSFSVSIILATVGIMDGYQSSLNNFIYRSEGQYVLTSRKGFFLETVIQKSNNLKLLPIVEVMGMALTEDDSLGVIINGVKSSNYFKMFGRRLKLNGNKILIGKELAKKLKKKVGDTLLISFLSNQGIGELPSINKFKIRGIVNFGIYKKNLRTILLDQNYLSSFIHQNGKINKLLLSFKNKSDLNIKELFEIENNLDAHFHFESSLRKFEYLIKAVKAEKVMIIIVLQLIVLISVFNLYTFINFLKEKKQQEFFLLKSLGVKNSQFFGFFLILITSLWGGACLLAIFLVSIYRMLLLEFDFLKLPGDIYHISRLNINLSTSDYLLVFLLTLFWIVFMIGISINKFSSVSVSKGLKGEMV